MLLDTGCLTLMAVILHDTGTQTQTLSDSFYFCRRYSVFNFGGTDIKHWEVCWS